MHVGCRAASLAYAAPLSAVVTRKNVSRHWQMSFREQIVQTENYCVSWWFFSHALGEFIG